MKKLILIALLSLDSVHASAVVGANLKLSCYVGYEHKPLIKFYSQTMFDEISSAELRQDDYYRPAFASGKAENIGDEITGGLLWEMTQFTLKNDKPYGSAGFIGTLDIVRTSMNAGKFKEETEVIQVDCRSEN